MARKAANIESLNLAIASLNDDAEDMHSLIVQSTGELERANEEIKGTTDVVVKTTETLVPLAKKLRSEIDDVSKLLVDTKGVVSDQLVATAKGLESIKAELTQSINDFTGLLTDELMEARKAGQNAFDTFSASSLKEAEKTRDDLQTDLLSHKAATAARMDSLENSISKLESAVEAAQKSTDGKIEGLQKKATLPTYGVIVVAILQIASLAALLLR